MAESRLRTDPEIPTGSRVNAIGGPAPRGESSDDTRRTQIGFKFWDDLRGIGPPFVRFRGKRPESRQKHGEIDLCSWGLGVEGLRVGFDPAGRPLGYEQSEGGP